MGLPFSFFVFFATASIYGGDLAKKKLTNENKIHHTVVLYQILLCLTKLFRVCSKQVRQVTNFNIMIFPYFFTN